MSDTTTIQGDFEMNAIAKAYGADQCKLLRTAYKKRGWTRTAIAVRNSSYSMGSSMRVEIKRPDLVTDYAEAERLANAGERVRRCEFSGEILSGGNRYVYFDFSDDALAMIAAPFLAASTAAMEKAEAEERDGYLTAVEGTDFHVQIDGWDVKIWGDSTLAFTINKHDKVEQSVAQQIGVGLFRAGRHPLQGK